MTDDHGAPAHTQRNTSISVSSARASTGKPGRLVETLRRSGPAVIANLSGRDRRGGQAGRDGVQR